MKSVPWQEYDIEENTGVSVMIHLTSRNLRPWYLLSLSQSLNSISSLSKTKLELCNDHSNIEQHLFIRRCTIQHRNSFQVLVTKTSLIYSVVQITVLGAY